MVLLHALYIYSYSARLTSVAVVLIPPSDLPTITIMDPLSFAAFEERAALAEARLASLEAKAATGARLGWQAGLLLPPLLLRLGTGGGSTASYVRRLCTHTIRLCTHTHRRRLKPGGIATSPGTGGRSEGADCQAAARAGSGVTLHAERGRLPVPAASNCNPPPPPTKRPAHTPKSRRATRMLIVLYQHG